MSFNIPKLDDLLGGVSDGRIVLIEGVGDIGFRLALMFLRDAVKKGFDVFAIIPTRMKRDLEKSMEIKIITPNGEITFHELFTISLAVKKLDERIGVIEILHSLLVVHSPEKVYQLYQDICEIIRQKNGILIATLDKKLVNEKVLAMFELESDYVIEISEIVEGLTIKRGIRVKKSPVNPPSDFYELHFNGDIVIGDKIV
jgi:archaellum biogenesis ATPase FlaH